MPTKNPITFNAVLTEASNKMLNRLTELPCFESRSHVVRVAIEKLYAERVTGEEPSTEFAWPVKSTSLLVKIPLTLNLDPSIPVPDLLKALHIFMDEYIMREKMKT